MMQAVGDSGKVSGRRGEAEYALGVGGSTVVCGGASQPEKQCGELGNSELE